MLKEFNIDLNLTAIFSLKKSPTCNSDLSLLSPFGNINITKVLKYFQNGELNKIKVYQIRLVQIYSDNSQIK